MSTHSRIALAAAVLGLAAAGCSDHTTVEPETGALSPAFEDPGFAPQSHTPTSLYEVTITNLTPGQPFSPPAVATHRAAIQMIPRRGFAGTELESIAEDGNNGPMVALFQGSPHVTQALDAGAPIHYSGSPNGPSSLTVMIEGRPGDRLSVATMLIATNDGFTGLRGVLLPKDEASYYTYAYDAGTEDNTEASADIVDPASGIGPVPLAGDPNGNENDDVNTSPQEAIGAHPGIAGVGDLTAAHAWDGAVASVTIKKVDQPVQYQVTLQNVSAYQPISPPVVATHAQGLHMFRTGQVASAEIEAIAEDGNGAPMVALLSGLAGVTDVVDVGMPLTRAGTVVGAFTDTAVITITANPGDRISLAGMLICTNDGIVGVDSAPLPPNSRTFWLRGLDAGTEDNTELSADIVDACGALGAVAFPGDGNDNAGVDTQPRERIRKHMGILEVGDLTQDDHGWSGAALKVTVERLP